MQIPHKLPSINNINHFEAILWDMDGTIMETEFLHILAVKAVLLYYHQNIKLESQDIEKICIGNTDKMILEELQKSQLLLNLTLEKFITVKDKYFCKELENTPLERIIKKEVIELITNISKSNIKQAVVTSSEKAITYVLLKKCELIQYFDNIITREDTTLNKPHPLPYLKAMEYFNVEPSKTLIFEDSITGTQAAIASKANVIKATWYS